jgi:hypothetical protein
LQTDALHGLDALTSVWGVIRNSFEPISTSAEFSGGRRSRGAVSFAALAVIALVFTSCGGDDDDAAASSTSTTIAVTVAPTTTAAAPAPTVAPTTVATTVPLVTEGAKVIVANASGINGAAGRMSDGLAVAGFSTGTATNSSEGQLEISKVYFDPANANAEAVANSVRQALGGGTIQVLEMGTPAPVESGEIGDASVVLAMGNDVADKTLDELQGLAAPAAAVTETSAPEG